MQKEGIDDEELSWFRDYLTGRKQTTKFGESTSSDQLNELGVAQSSCLGPSLFIFYMNRIAGAVGEARFNLFADDTLISVAEYSPASLSHWLKQHKLNLNIEKTNYMVLSHKKNLFLDEVKIKIDDIEL
jgi:hypothetical protein